MTTPTPPTPNPAGPAPNPDTTDAVQTALSAEYAAVWSYTLVTAFLSDSLKPAAQRDLQAHRARRDATIRLLTDHGVGARAAEPAYRTPRPVTDSDSAVALLMSAETDVAAAWRSVIERCDSPGLRRTALDGLTEGATLLARWAVESGVKPPIAALPGQSQTPPAR
ncbi:MAG TPA: ferritin-like domain-containing protein [Pseudonocardia sp.]|nr:ferritin-like domain-containing protein [Pseudonocardia sp.]